jgi:hypothetical protein
MELSLRRYVILRRLLGQHEGGTTKELSTTITEFLIRRFKAPDQVRGDESG